MSPSKGKKSPSDAVRQLEQDASSLCESDDIDTPPGNPRQASEPFTSDRVQRKSNPNQSSPKHTSNIPDIDCLITEAANLSIYEGEQETASHQVGF